MHVGIKNESLCFCTRGGGLVSFVGVYGVDTGFWSLDIVVVCEDVLSFDVYKNAKTKIQNNWFIVMRKISELNLNTINASASGLWQITTVLKKPRRSLGFYDSFYLS